MDKSNQNIILYLIIGVTAMLLFGFSFLLVVVRSQRKKSQLQKSLSNLKEQQQNQLIESAVLSEEQERHRIAETLHDEVGAILSSAKLHLLGIKAASLDEKDKTLHEKGKGLLNDVIQKVRGISHNLHSNILKEFGLNEAIRHFLFKITEGSLLHATTSLDDNYTTIKPEEDISVYRMVQELVNNILKYAEASELIIGSTCHPTFLELFIFHNGTGLTQDQFETLRYQKEGLGLKNIQNRVILLKGDIQFTKVGEGYRITIRIPVK